MALLVRLLVRLVVLALVLVALALVALVVVAHCQITSSDRPSLRWSPESHPSGAYVSDRPSFFLSMPLVLNTYEDREVRGMKKVSYGGYW